MRKCAVSVEIRMSDPVSISWLPDSVLLEVLSFLSVRDLIRSGRVCKRWKRMISDKTLWKHVNLTPYKLNSKIMWHFVRHWLRTSLQTLKLKGLLHSVKKQEYLTPAILQEMAKRFSCLENLHLEQTSLHSISYDCFPSTLKTLELSQCEIPMVWFNASSNQSRSLPKLENLMLNNVSSFSNHHLETVCSQSVLKTLFLSGTYRVTDIGIQKSLLFLKGLQHLKLQSCNITDIALHLIGCHLKCLQTLALTNISMTDAGLACLSSIKTLEKLWLEYSIHLSSDSIIAVCVTLPALNFLCLNGIFEGHGSIDEIKKKLPNCKVTC